MGNINLSNISNAVYSVTALIAATSGFFIVLYIVRWLRGDVSKPKKLNIDQKINSRQSGRYHSRGTGQGAMRGSRGMWKNNSSRWN